jgi:hypothetical protein
MLSNRPARRLLKSGLQVVARRVNRGQHADGEADEARHDEREHERHRVDVDRRETRQPGGACRDERAQPYHGDEHPEPAAEERQDHALRDELAHETRAAGAQRGA